MIQNPILKGFNPDPSIVRAGEDYYIAVSTFTWFGGVQIHHSRDLKHWRLHSRPLSRISQLDMTGIPNGGGVWAPCLTYDNGTFYLVYTIVKQKGLIMQTDNYLVTTTDIDGEWSEPIYLDSDGFDPSLFHGSDGTRWLLNLDNHYREGQHFNGLYLYRLDDSLQVTGKRVKIYDNPSAELVEGSHIYQHGGYYYLLKAQGGTGVQHSSQMARSKSLFGPYEDCPFMLMTSRNNPAAPLQKAGHADLVETQNGEWYMVHLSSTWISGTEVSTLGRETSIQKVEWTEDGWLRLSSGGHCPQVLVEEAGLPEVPFPAKPERVLFDTGVLDSDFQTLRLPLTEEELSFSARPGYLRLRGGAGLTSNYRQSLIARRMEAHHAQASAWMEFEPDTEKEMAGLVVMYDTEHWYYLFVSRNDETGRKELNVLGCDRDAGIYPAYARVILDEHRPVVLRADINGKELAFSYSYGEEMQFEQVVAGLDMTILTDEHIPIGFMGTMLGICCQDLHRYRKHADFKWFEYRNLR